MLRFQINGSLIPPSKRLHLRSRFQLVYCVFFSLFDFHTLAASPRNREGAFF
ncbi:hypothetical protein COCON_G00018200 [Conger conger]|uniref:Uncharacterized protein n=1 Tax=Conger conger TaxID=82655 RepID=A0A9Q1E3V2_CONCO|nr:hypothetical protein COCON_G00018200 [Conger conger]